MTFIDGYAYASRITKADPKAKVLFSIAPLVICLAMDSIFVSLLALAVMGAATMWFARLNLKRYLHFLLIPFGFLVIGTITIMVNQYMAGTPLLLGIQMGDYSYGISTASLLKGGGLILKALACVSCMYFLSFNTPMTSLFSELGRIKQLDIVVSLMELIYRYIFVLWDESERIRTAQESRLGYRNLRAAFASTGTLISMLFFRAYQRCDRTFSALESRGFQGQLAVVADDYTACPRLYWGAGALAAALIAAGVIKTAFIGAIL